MAEGNDFPFYYTNMLPIKDRFLPDSEGQLKHTDYSPPLEFQVKVRQRTTK
jgi:hypothetical protein